MMPQFPIRVPRDGYRGSNPARRRKQDEYDRAARKLEEHVNKVMTACPDNTHVFIYGLLALELGIPQKMIAEVLAGIGGHTGMMVWKGSASEVGAP
jgi:hypothetical protein